MISPCFVLKQKRFPPICPCIKIFNYILKATNISILLLFENDPFHEYSTIMSSAY